MLGRIGTLVFDLALDFEEDTGPVTGNSREYSGIGTGLVVACLLAEAANWSIKVAGMREGVHRQVCRSVRLEPSCTAKGAGTVSCSMQVVGYVLVAESKG